ncbi:MAG: radical SAM protein, partial [Nitrospirae bacterium]|nr:radical SAM protein [Nitrospirota bacterium]
MTRVAFYNLGCKVNQFDAAAMESVLQEEGGYTSVPFGEEADVYVVNTCTVTGKSDHEARQAIRRAVRLNRNAKVVVTGCYAQTHPEEIAKIEGVSLVLGNLEKFDLKEHLNVLVHSCTPASQGKEPMVFVGNIHGNSRLRQPEISGFPFKTRAFLKVQDGCNLRCSFCIIPEARGGSRSLSLARVVEQVTVLEGEGYQEVILTGIHLGSYGCDLAPRTSLPKLLEALLRETRIPR